MYKHIRFIILVMAVLVSMPLTPAMADGPLPNDPSPGTKPSLVRRFPPPDEKDPTTRVIVQFAPVNNYSDSLSRSLSTSQMRLRARDYRQFSILFDGAAMEIDSQDVDWLKSLPQVEAVWPDYEVRATISESVPLIGAPTLWSMTDTNGKPVTGRGIKIAILDTGIDYTHPDLGGCLGTGCRVKGGYDFVNNDADPKDDYGHGTHVAGIVGANGTLKGVAPGADLYAYKVLDANGNGYASWIISGLEQAVADGAQVMNLSLGGPGSPDDPLSTAVNNAVNGGAVVVVSAGNEGAANYSIQSPGVASKALTVAASTKEDQIVYFSSRGPLPDNLDLKPDISAPGYDIYSTVLNGEYASYNGTSMAAPHVAGGAALIRQLHPDWTPDMIKSNLMNTAKNIGDSVLAMGAGRIDLSRAADATLIATPSSISLQIPFPNRTTVLSLHNTSHFPITVSATATVSLVYDPNFSDVPPISVNYVTLSRTTIIVNPGLTQTFNVKVTLPPDALPGYYEGRIHLQYGSHSIDVPVMFAALGKITLGYNGPNIYDPAIVCIRDLSGQVNRCNQAALSVYVPLGTYYAHAMANLYALVEYNHFHKPLLPGYFVTQPVSISQYGARSYIKPSSGQPSNYRGSNQG
jgi:subtilisin family serine protease